MDIPKIYTALAEWLSCMALILSQRALFPRGTSLRSSLVCMLGLPLLSLTQTLCGMTEGPLWLMGMGVAVLLMFSMLRLTLSGKTATVWFMAARVFLRAEWMAALEWQLDRYYAPPQEQASLRFSLIFCLLLFSLLTLAFYLTERFYIQRKMSPQGLDLRPGSALGIWLLALTVFCFGNLSYVQIATPFQGTELREIFNIRSLADLAGVILLELLTLEKLNEAHLREEDAIQSVLRMQYQQFRQSQENIDLINRKYHDLKHQLQVIRSEKDGGRALAHLDELEDELHVYEMQVNTGNAVLDTILTSKGRLCLDHHIQMRVVADGSALSHLHVMDLATIFGNALDNAIEHEVQGPDPEKRLIHVSVSQKASMICIVIENYFQGELKQIGGELLTTKSDKRYHGYGLKSIRYTVEKHHGIFQAGVEDDWFRVKILLPM